MIPSHFEGQLHRLEYKHTISSKNSQFTVYVQFQVKIHKLTHEFVVVTGIDLLSSMNLQFQA